MASHGEDDRRSKKPTRITLAKARSDGTAEGSEAQWGGKVHGRSYGVGEDSSRGARSENQSGQGGSRVYGGRTWRWPAMGGERQVELPEKPTAPRREGRSLESVEMESEQWRVYQLRYRASGIGRAPKRVYQ